MVLLPTFIGASAMVDAVRNPVHGAFREATVSVPGESLRWGQCVPYRIGMLL